MKIALIIFTKNERKNSERIFPKISKNVVDAIYVIDGDSSDGTQEFWKSKGVEVFGQNYPGVGGAYESAFKKTKEEALIFFHPDGNMDPNAIKKFAKFLRKGEQFIVATRMTKEAFNEEDVELLKPRKWFCQGLGLITNIFWGRKGNKCKNCRSACRYFCRS